MCLLLFEAKANKPKIYGSQNFPFSISETVVDFCNDFGLFSCLCLDQTNSIFKTFKKGRTWFGLCWRRPKIITHSPVHSQPNNAYSGAQIVQRRLRDHLFMCASSSWFMGLGLPILRRAKPSILVDDHDTKFQTAQKKFGKFS